MNYLDESYIAPGSSIIEFWDWDFGDGSDIVTDTNPDYAYTTPGFYTITLIVTSNFGCTDTTTEVLTIFPKPQADFIFSPDVGTLLNPFETFTDQTVSDSLTTWYWDFGDSTSSNVPNPVHEYPDTGTYQVMLAVLDTNACRDTVYHALTILPEYIFFIPNTFTPNGDGFNDVFLPKGVGINETGYQFYIFNRWGDIIWETDDFEAPWYGNGNDGSSLVQTGVYVWLIISRDYTGDVHQYTGHITLIQ